jgi:aminopeptidase N
MLLPLLLFSALADSLTGPGVSQPLATLRAAQIKNVQYDLSLDVTQRDTAMGRVLVRFDLTKPGEVILDYRGPRVIVGAVNGREGRGATVNGAHVVIPAGLTRIGTNEIELGFASLIAPSGASIIRYHDSTDGADYLYTLLVPADANQLFPCFDQPDLKARVTLDLTTPAGWTALGNGAVLGTDSLGTGTRFRFRQTEPLSTYLIAFAAGPWAQLTTRESRKPITLYVRASRAREAEADSIILANDQAATWLEQYFDSPFPFHKLDVLLAPAFPFGGMEHPGAIFYNEDRFIYRERATRPQRLGRTATIYHEVSHQWFGDLVTMRWFDDLWLKEGFATYMAAKMQAALDPASDPWKTFYLRNKPAAYTVDMTSGTTPVWQTLANLDQAKSNYGAIVYNKAPSILKQLNYLVGDRVFQEGLRRFTKRYAYANATWRDLLGAVGTAYGRSLAAWGEQYILRPGLPVVEQRLTVRGDTLQRLTLIQRPARPLSGAGAWPMKIEVMLYYPDAAPVLLPVSIVAETTVVNVGPGRRAPAFAFANAGDQGYGLVLLDDRSVRWLEQAIGSVGDGFLRAMLWSALWDLVREARLDPARYVELALRELPAERDEQISGSLLNGITRSMTAYLVASRRDSLQQLVERSLRAGVADTTRAYDIRKQQLDALIRVARTPSALAHLDALLDSATAAGDRLRPPTRWAIVTRLIEMNAPEASRRYASEMRTDSTSDGRRRAFVAGAARGESAVKRDYFTRYFADSTLNEDWVTASAGPFNALDQQALTLPYLVPALDSLRWIQRNRRIFFLGAWLGDFLGGQTSLEALGRVETYLRAHPELPADLRQKVLQASDELTRTVRIRESQGRRTAARPSLSGVFGPGP